MRCRRSAAGILRAASWTGSDWARAESSRSTWRSWRPGLLQVIIATAQDITKRKTAEEALRQSEARFRSAFENTLFGMAIIALADRYLQVNQSLCQITGFFEQELLRTNFSAITRRDDVREDQIGRASCRERV